ncbi:MAG TPA: hypothetical protein VI916_11245 [Acidimicrobiia bacterium]|nr:hypothetical protein [Acidimicrobiia bacterium]
MKRVAIGAAIVVAAVAALPLSGVVDLGGDDGPDESRTERTSLDGRPLRAGEDWNGTGVAGSLSEQTGGASGDGSGGADGGGTATGATPATTPYGCAGTEQEDPPPEFANPLGGTPNNDFVLKATITPLRGDAGSEVTIDVVAVGEPKALAVIAASFYDQEDHGMKAAKFTDATGRAQFKGPIPRDAPIGWAAIAVSVSTRDNESAVDILNFIVTGPGCD